MLEIEVVGKSGWQVNLCIREESKFVVKLGDEMGRRLGCNHGISVRHLVLAVLCVHAFLHDLAIQSATVNTYWYTGASRKFNLLNTTSFNEINRPWVPG